MKLKYQVPIPGQQPNAVAGALATMALPSRNRIGAIYAKLKVTKAAGGSGVTSLPLLTDIADPSQPLAVKINGNIQINRLASELAAENKLSSNKATGRVDYFQAGAWVASVNDVQNTTAPAALATNTATTAVFQLPIYFIPYFYKNLKVAESLAWPTVFSNGARLPQITVEIPLADNAGAVFSDHNCALRWDFDTAIAPATYTIPAKTGKAAKTIAFTSNGIGSPFIVKKLRYTQGYAATGDLSVTPIIQTDRLMQFSLLVAAGDFISRVQVKKNSVMIRDVYWEDNAQAIFDKELNIDGVVRNRFDVIFDNNDNPLQALALTQNDTFEIIATLKTVAAANTMVILTQSFGRPN